MANSSMLVLPMTMMPASNNRFTDVAVKGGTKPSNIFEPQVHGSPATVSTSLIAIGMPSRGAIYCAPACCAPVDFRVLSASSACFNADSPATCKKACSEGSSFDMRSSVACTSSRLEYSPLFRPACISVRVRAVRSVMFCCKKFLFISLKQWFRGFYKVPLRVPLSPLW